MKTVSSHAGGATIVTTKKIIIISYFISNKNVLIKNDNTHTITIIYVRSQSWTPTLLCDV